jgi:hypothetical protein
MISRNQFFIEGGWYDKEVVLECMRTGAIVSEAKLVESSSEARLANLINELSMIVAKEENDD